MSKLLRASKVTRRPKAAGARLRHALAAAAVWLLAAGPVSAQTETVTYIHTDLFGSPLAGTGAAGDLLWKENYQPYGARFGMGAGAANNVRFHGKPVDQTTGLSEFGARWYDGQLGRFMGVDPAGFDEGNLHSFNRYAYGNNNPYKYVDPDGRMAVPLVLLLIIGAGLTIHELTSTPAPPPAGSPDAIWPSVGPLEAATTVGVPAKSALALSWRSEVVLADFLRGESVRDATRHARNAIQEGCCTTGVVDRAGAEARRKARLQGTTTKPGYDRDEFPPAVVKPDNPEHSVDHVITSHNRRSGARLGQELKGVKDGTRVRIKAPTE